MKTRKKIDYKPLCEKAVKIMKLTNELVNQISRFELSQPIRAEIDEIQELSQKNSKVKLKKPYKKLFSDLMEDFCQIDDDLHEIEMVAGELISEVNKLPQENRKTWYEFAGIKDIPKEFEGLSEELQEKIYEIMGEVSEILEKSSKYYLLEKEDYADYENEIENS